MFKGEEWDEKSLCFKISFIYLFIFLPFLKDYLHTISCLLLYGKGAHGSHEAYEKDYL